MSDEAETVGNLGQQSPEHLIADFKSAMRKFAATVALLTTVEEGARHGMPATAVSSLSMDPPSLLVCINQSASMHGPTTRSRYFCVNLLSDAQADVLRDFGARASAERFGIGAWREGPHGLPCLVGAAASVFCAVEHELHYGTHTVFVGRVVGVQTGGAAQSLIYQAGTAGRFLAG